MDTKTKDYFSRCRLERLLHMLPLTFSLDLIHADSILGVERSDFTGRQRVSSLNPRGHRVRRRLHGFDERLRACNRHGATAKLLQLRLCPRPSPESLQSGTLPEKKWCLYLFIYLFIYFKCCD